MKLLLAILKLPFTILKIIFHLPKIIKHIKNPPGLPRFKDPHTSGYKDWFNKNHVGEEPKNNEDLIRYGHDLLIFCAGDQDFSDGLAGNLSPAEIKLRNEITTYELACYHLSVLHHLVKSKKHKDEGRIIGVTVNRFNDLSAKVFNLDPEALRKQTIDRMSYYVFNRDKLNPRDLMSAITIQAVAGFQKKKLCETIPVQDYNMLDFEIAIHAPKIAIAIKERPDGLPETWEKLLFGQFYK